MSYKKCPICEVNYILDTQDRCVECGGREPDLPDTDPKPPIYHKIKGHAFFVFQGKTYGREIAGQYIEAPSRHLSGRTIHHWERMLDVRIGDFILHGNNGEIVAVSIAKSTAALTEINEEYKVPMWRIELETFRLPMSLSFVAYSDILLTMQPNIHSPFNKRGGGNQGYLFDIYSNMVEYVLDRSIELSMRNSQHEIFKELKKRFYNRYGE